MQEDAGTQARIRFDQMTRKQMEAALLAADALAASVGRSDSWFEIDAALDVYRTATGAA